MLQVFGFFSLIDFIETMGVIVVVTALSALVGWMVLGKLRR